MAVLIRFEDTYGMADICTATKMKTYIKEFIPKEHAKELVKINRDIVLQTGMSTKFLFRMYDEDAEEIRESSITDIIFVFDLDNWSGDKTKILQIDDLNTGLQSFKKYMREYGLNLNLYFIPTMYAAETFYLYILYDCKMNPCEIVSNYNTNEVHGALVAAKLHRSSTKSAKNIRDEILGRDISYYLSDELEKGRFGNTETIKWLLESVDLLSHTFDESKLKSYLKEANGFFEKHKVCGENRISVMGKILDINDSDEVKRFINEFYKKGVK